MAFIVLHNTTKRLKSTTTALVCALVYRMPIIFGNKKIAKYKQRALSSIDIPVCLTNLCVCTTFTGPIAGETLLETYSSSSKKHAPPAPAAVVLGYETSVLLPFYT